MLEPTHPSRAPRTSPQAGRARAQIASHPFLALTDSANSLNRSPLHDAAEAGDVELITKLLSKESADGDFNPVRAHHPDTIAPADNFSATEKLRSPGKTQSHHLLRPPDSPHLPLTHHRRAAPTTMTIWT